jgi:hypothetical protein
MPGLYKFNAYCEVGMVVADWIVDAESLTVEEGSYFGTGKLRPVDHKDLIV